MASKPQKKTPKKRKTTKRKRIPKKRESRVIKDLLILFVLMVLVVAVGAGYYWGEGNRSVKVEKTQSLKKKILVKKKKISIEIGKSPKEQDVKYCKDKPSKIHLWLFGSQDQGIEYCRVKPKELNIGIEKIEEVPDTPPKDTKVSSDSVHIKRVIVERSRRPKLVIIIDDVATPRQLRKILSLPLKLTPSIFPPSKRLKSTAKMAKNLKHYMIHLPMQAGNHPRGAMLNTLMINDSKDTMRARVKALRRWFPSAIYVNNHTGSLFTSDHRSLHTLYGLLREEGFVFVDSRTSSKNKGRRVAKEYGDFYIHRDIFIDNIQKSGAIRKQLKRAIKKAKRRGYAIAIGHPHNITLRSLKNSLDILADVDVVYLDELMGSSQ